MPNKLVSEPFVPGSMANKNVTQRVEHVEEVLGSVQQELQRNHQDSQREVGSLKEDMAKIQQQLALLLNQRSDSTPGGSSMTERMKEKVTDSGGYSPMSGDPLGHAGLSPNGGNRYDFRFRKLEMPVFDGTNPDGWILKAERYFGLNQFSNDEKLEAAVVAFEGDALLWFQWETKKRKMVLWEELKILLLKHFRSMNTGSLYEQWLALEQVGDVRDYRRRFMELSAPLE